MSRILTIIGIVFDAIGFAILSYDLLKGSKAKQKLEEIQEFITRLDVSIFDLKNSPKNPSAVIAGQKVDDIEKLLADAAGQANQANRKQLVEMMDAISNASRHQTLLLWLGTICVALGIVFQTIAACVPAEKS